MNRMKPLCALTMGDPAGVGPEVVLKTILSDRARNAADMIVIGYREVFERDASLLGLDIEINPVLSPGEIEDRSGVLNLMSPGGEVSLVRGVVDSLCGKAAAKCIELSAELALKGMVDAVVTAPICKESLHAAGYGYPGHTEFYQSLTNSEEVGMMLSLGDFRVIHVTTHTSIASVPALIKKDRIVRTSVLMNSALELLGIIEPRLAVAGLNPHSGEAGMFGEEEIREIAPAVEELKSRGINAVGPLPPDTVFARAYCGEYDGVVAMYHDQGHIALKLAGFKFGECSSEVGGVNTTLGLPIIRTSVDHGTAFDIAGKGIASPLSMIEAVEMAAALAKGMKNKGEA